ncbi:hypothetical protein [Fulvivirga sedimenti]|uniref:Uncharacterized protein n=1 Tax=Fulvivirga sedimenti TaxID=2879465 RepID=A0A9X1HPS8_9BACT|nr:hypothetical protein [Fulvivirga sedimenti]MCA6074950.1 hypothetical protein [Fulvivirga sedimenti]MCA6076127.1 hypothetical protein [Fulvivirga sedimenti]MCA6077255.1 hypothetical protein [Fulvivirga sedimenti]
MIKDNGFRDNMLLLAFLTLLVYLGFRLHGDTDIQLHDTYFVFSPLTVMMLMMAPVWMLVLLRRSIRTRFRSVPSIIALIIAIVAFGWVWIPFISAVMDLST